jgi:hypothetical protein
VNFQRSSDEPRQPDSPAPGSGLRKPEEQLAFHFGHDLGHGDRAAQQVDATSAQARQLTDPQAAVRADQHQRSIQRSDGVGQRDDLGRSEEPHLLTLDLRQRHLAAGRLRQIAGVDGGTHHLAEDLVGLGHGRRS